MQTQYHIKPLFNQILFRIIDLDAIDIDGFILANGAKGKRPAAHVIDIGPDCHAVAIGDNCIMAEGVSAGGYTASDGSLVHLINEQCVVGKYVEVAETGITMLS